jgi:hypothetical protein
VQQVGGQECGEHLVRIRILEQEAERHLRRVQNLEHQLADMEKKTQERVEQVLTKYNILNPQYFVCRLQDQKVKLRILILILSIP